MGTITKLADDQGRLRDNAALIRSNIFPLDDVPLNDIEQAIQLFSIDGRIVRYKKDGKKLIQIVNWWKHQKPRWASASNYPAPDGWIDRYRYHGQGNVIIELNWNKSGGYIADSIVCEDEDDVKDDDKSEDEIKISTAAIFKSYQDNIGQLSGVIAEKIEADILEYSANWVLEAIERATVMEKRSLGYVQGILKGWKRDGKNSLKPSATGNKKTIKLDGQTIEVGMP